MKKIICIILMICIAMSLCACANESQSKKGPGQSAVETFVELLGSGNYQKVSSCVPPELIDRLERYVANHSDWAGFDPKIISIDVQYNRQIRPDEIEQIKGIYRIWADVSLDIQEAHEYYWSVTKEYGSDGSDGGDDPMLAVKIRDRWYGIPYKDSDEYIKRVDLTR